MFICSHLLAAIVLPPTGCVHVCMCSWGVLNRTTVWFHTLLLLLRLLPLTRWSHPPLAAVHSSSLHLCHVIGFCCPRVTLPLLLTLSHTHAHSLLLSRSPSQPPCLSPSFCFYISGSLILLPSLAFKPQQHRLRLLILILDRIYHLTHSHTSVCMYACYIYTLVFFAVMNKKYVHVFHALLSVLSQATPPGQNRCRAECSALLQPTQTCTPFYRHKWGRAHAVEGLDCWHCMLEVEQVRSGQVCVCVHWHA